ncbi:MAG: DUF3662 and FHA domain-containing protein [Anaerolineae bacterium]
MSDQISRLEAQLERLIEGAFTQLFGKSIRPQDIALRLSRAMEDHLRPSDDGDPRPYAPDHYLIHLNPDVCSSLLNRQPALTAVLSRHIVDLATFAEYRLSGLPAVELIPDAAFDASELEVIALHVDTNRNLTEVLTNAETPKPDAPPAPRNPHLIINGGQMVPLNQPVMNVGRSRDNHIVLEDLHVSRHHVQLRLRFGHYTVFDTNSQAGTKVNNVVIREHRLQTGDVIRIGKTQMVYIEDTPTDDQTGVAASLHS